MKVNDVSRFKTSLTLTHKRLYGNDRLLFGLRYASSNDRSDVVDLTFSSTQTFGFVRWRGDEYGTQTWRVMVTQAGRPGERLTRIPGVSPGAHLLLHAFGKVRAKRALRAIDVLSDSHVLHEIAPAYWRHVHVQIARNKPFEPYDAQAFAAMSRARLVS
jgi:hypothetical protein